MNRTRLLLVTYNLWLTIQCAAVINISQTQRAIQPSPQGNASISKSMYLIACAGLATGLVHTIVVLSPLFATFGALTGFTVALEFYSLIWLSFLGGYSVGRDSPVLKGVGGTSLVFGIAGVLLFVWSTKRAGSANLEWAENYIHTQDIKEPKLVLGASSLNDDRYPDPSFLYLDQVEAPDWDETKRRVIQCDLNDPESIRRVQKTLGTRFHKIIFDSGVFDKLRWADDEPLRALKDLLVQGGELWFDPSCTNGTRVVVMKELPDEKAYLQLHEDENKDSFSLNCFLPLTDNAERTAYNYYLTEEYMLPHFKKQLLEVFGKGNVERVEYIPAEGMAKYGFKLRGEDKPQTLFKCTNR